MIYIYFNIVVIVSGAVKTGEKPRRRLKKQGVRQVEKMCITPDLSTIVPSMIPFRAGKILLSGGKNTFSPGLRPVPEAS